MGFRVGYCCADTDECCPILMKHTQQKLRGIKTVFKYILGFFLQIQVVEIRHVLDVVFDPL